MITEKIISIQRNNGSWYKRKMNKTDVISYFKKIRSSKGEQKIPGTYCERCGINMGDSYHFKKGKAYKGFYLCPSCYNDKTTSKKETTPDLEDLKRINN